MTTIKPQPRPASTYCEVCDRAKSKLLEELRRAICENDRSQSWPDWVYKVKDAMKSQNQDRRS